MCDFLNLRNYKKFQLNEQFKIFKFKKILKKWKIKENKIIPIITHINLSLKITTKNLNIILQIIKQEVVIDHNILTFHIKIVFKGLNKKLVEDRKDNIEMLIKNNKIKDILKRLPIKHYSMILEIGKRIISIIEKGMLFQNGILMKIDQNFPKKAKLKSEILSPKKIKQKIVFIFPN